MKPVFLFLTCKDDNEAKEIATVLLQKRLIVCAKRFSVSSTFLWEGKIDSGDEVMLTMDSVEELFEQVEKAVRKNHSYDTFVLTAVPVAKVSRGVAEWMKEELKKR